MAENTANKTTEPVGEPVAASSVAATPAAPEAKTEVSTISAENEDEAKAGETVPEPATAAVTVDHPPPIYSGPIWPTLNDDHPLSKFFDDLPELLKTAEYDEVYGVKLQPKTEGSTPNFHTLLILQKFLRANADDVEKAKEQLRKTLAWRKTFQPAKAMTEIFKREKFGGLGFVTVTSSKGGEGTPKVVTWNIYGAVKDYEKTFVPVDEFLRWRIALMEFGVSKLNLKNAEEPIPDFGKGIDPYQGIQIHDYKSVSFLRMDPRAKAASKQTIQMLGDYYPETLSRKFFVNVPLVMQWMFATMKLFVSAETTKKFVVLSDGVYVAGELGESVPKEYGGKLGALAEVGEAMKLE